MSPWSALEQSHRLKHVAAIWRQRRGETFPVFQAALLQRTPERARAHPCPRNCGCAHEVIREGTDDFAAVCRCERWNCDTFTVTPEQLALWELSWTRLGRALCQALGLDRRHAVLGLPSTHQIGSWSAAAVPVLLTIQADPDNLRGVIAELAARLRRPYILLVPTSRHLTAAALELLAAT